MTTPQRRSMLVQLSLLSVGALTPAVGCGPAASRSGNICTVAGTGIAGDGAVPLPPLETRLYLPQDMTVGPDGRLFVVDWNNHRIRVIDTDGLMKIVAGAGNLVPCPIFWRPIA